MGLIGLLFGLKGRMARGTYWKIKLAVVFVIGAIVLAVMQAGHAQPGDRHGFDHALQSLPPMVHGAVMAGIALALWVLFAAHTKRLHDLDLSGWRVIATYWLCLFRDGTAGPNRYGPDPLVSTPPQAT